MKLKFLATLGLIGFLSFQHPVALGASPITITYDGITHTYSDTQVKYKMNDKEVKTKYPGIIVNGVSLASLDDIFVRTGTGIKYKYNKKQKTILLSKGQDKLTMKLGSKEGKWNRETKWLPLEPRIVKFSNGKSKLYVPARFVATQFGFRYEWFSSEGIASIKGEVVEVAPSEVAKKKEDNSKTKVIFLANNKKLNSAKLPGVYVDSVLMGPAKDIFLNEELEGGYTYNKKKKTVTLEFDDKILTMKLGSKDASLNKKKIKLSKAPVNVKFNFSGKTAILVPIEEVLSNLGLKLKINGAIAQITPPPIIGEETKVKEEKIDSSTGQTDMENKKDDKRDPKKDETPKKDIGQAGKEVALGTLFQWESSRPEYQSQSNQASIKGFDLNPYITSSIFDIIQLETSEGQKYDTYMIFSNNGFFNVSGQILDKELSLKLDGFVMEEKRNFFFKTGGLAERVETQSDLQSGVTSVKFQLSEGLHGYQLSLSPDNKVLTVKMLRKALTKIALTKETNLFRMKLSATDFINISTLDRMDSGTVQFTIRNLEDAIGIQNFLMEQSEGIYNVIYQSAGENLILTIAKNPNYGFSLKQNGREAEIVIAKMEYLEYGIMIPTPSDSATFRILDADDYLNERIVLTFPMNLSSYFLTNPIYYDASKVEGYQINTDLNGNTILTFKTKGMTAYRIFKTQSFVGLRLGKANEFYKKVVVIDPGHGGSDTGAKSPDKEYNEKDIVLAVGHDYFKDYLSDPDLKVYWTRTGDTFMTLADRAKFASRIGADLFVSVHANAAASKKANGTEVYYSTRNNVILPNGLSSFVMASKFQNNLVSGMKTLNRGVKPNVFVVTNINTVPAVLLELGFMTNTKDLAMLVDEEKQDEMAGILYNTIVELFASYPTGR